jgi:hypothetical protein
VPLAKSRFMPALFQVGSTPHGEALVDAVGLKDQNSAFSSHLDLT